MGKQLDYVTCKERHFELWDFVVGELEAAKNQALPIPCIGDVKKDFFSLKGYEMVVNLCFACHVAEERLMKNPKIGTSCFVCPLAIARCIRKGSHFMDLQDCEDTMDYDKAIKLAKKIRDSWEE